MSWKRGENPGRESAAQVFCPPRSQVLRSALAPALRLYSLGTFNCFLVCQSVALVDLGDQVFGLFFSRSLLGVNIVDVVHFKLL